MYYASRNGSLDVVDKVRVGVNKGKLGMTEPCGVCDGWLT